MGEKKSIHLTLPKDILHKPQYKCSCIPPLTPTELISICNNLYVCHYQDETISKKAIHGKASVIIVYNPTTSISIFFKDGITIDVYKASNITTAHSATNEIYKLLTANGYDIKLKDPNDLVRGKLVNYSFSISILEKNRNITRNKSFINLDKLVKFVEPIVKLRPHVSPPHGMMHVVDGIYRDLNNTIAIDNIIYKLGRVNSKVHYYKSPLTGDYIVKYNNMTYVLPKYEIIEGVNYHTIDLNNLVVGISHETTLTPKTFYYKYADKPFVFSIASNGTVSVRGSYIYRDVLYIQLIIKKVMENFIKIDEEVFDPDYY